MAPKAATSPLGGLVRGYMGHRSAEMHFSKTLSFALTQNILFNKKFSSVLHPKLRETKIFKSGISHNIEALFFICPNSFSMPKGALPCYCFFFWYSINYISSAG